MTSTCPRPVTRSVRHGPQHPSRMTTGVAAKFRWLCDLHGSVSCAWSGTAVARDAGMRPITFAWLTIGTTLAVTLVSGSQATAQIIVPGYPYPAYRYAMRDASVRFDVKPNDASVYVDGYYAGIVDDFDGTFQRLRTAPGGHEITVYLEGHRTYTERVYLSPDTTFKFRH